MVAKLRVCWLYRLRIDRFVATVAAGVASWNKASWLGTILVGAVHQYFISFAVIRIDHVHASFLWAVFVMVGCLETMPVGATKSRAALFAFALFVAMRHTGNTRCLGSTVAVIVVPYRHKHFGSHLSIESFKIFDICRELTTIVYTEDIRTSGFKLFAVLKPVKGT